MWTDALRLGLDVLNRDFNFGADVKAAIFSRLFGQHIRGCNIAEGVTKGQLSAQWSEREKSSRWRDVGDATSIQRQTMTERIYDTAVQLGHSDPVRMASSSNASSQLVSGSFKRKFSYAGADANSAANNDAITVASYKRLKMNQNMLVVVIPSAERARAKSELVNDGLATPPMTPSTPRTHHADKSVMLRDRDGKPFFTIPKEAAKMLEALIWPSEAPQPDILFRVRNEW